ncbi:hypothetical protein EON62_02835, partial [archaeon]
LFFIVNLLFIPYDISRFGGDPSSTKLRAAIIIRLAGLMPITLGVIGFTFTRYYERHSHWLALPLLLFGSCIIVYTILGASPGYGPIALLIAFLFACLPLPVWVSALVSALFIVGYAVGLWVTRADWVANISLVDSAAPEASSSSNMIMFNILGVLTSFAVIVFLISHTLEQSLKQSYLDELRLKYETHMLQNEQELSSSLLNSMLPPQIVQQLQAGTGLIAEFVPIITVLFCELDLDTAKYDAHTIVTILNIVFSEFDALVDDAVVRKIETVALVWLGASSPFMHEDDAERHAVYVAELAINMVAVLPSIRRRILEEAHVDGSDINFRIGINSGAVAAGIVGIKNPRCVVPSRSAPRHHALRNAQRRLPKLNYACAYGTRARARARTCVCVCVGAGTNLLATL